MEPAKTAWKLCVEFGEVTCRLSSSSFTTKVAPQFTGTPTGTVTFKDGATVLATVGLSGGSAAFTTHSLAHGTHSITATFNGNTNFNTNISATMTSC